MEEGGWEGPRLGGIALAHQRPQPFNSSGGATKASEAAPARPRATARPPLNQGATERGARGAAARR